MKKTLSLLLATLMVVTVLVPALSFSAVAVAPDTDTVYAIYQQDFENVDSGAVGTVLLEQLGWSIPTAKADTNQASYTISQYGTNKSLRVDNRGAEYDSFINIFGGEVMSILRNTNFKLSYRLTYSPDTTDADGYASIIYNYNGMHGKVADGTGNEVYGIVAVRMCGTGFNSVYYPAQGADCDFHSLERALGGPNVMANRYDTVAAQPSLYARLFGVAENGDTVRKGTPVMGNKVLDIEIDYNYVQGITVYINGQLVSESIPSVDYNAQIRNAVLWSDFLTRNSGETVALLATPGVVADIDNIKITTTDINASGINAQMPALVITEICGAPNPSWAEFVEIYNPNDFAVDVANYSLVRSSTVTDGSAIDAIEGSRKGKFSTYVNLGTLFGAEQLSTRKTYKTEDELKSMSSDTYSYVDSKTYAKDAGGNFVAAEGGPYRYIQYKDIWNTRYIRGSADYETNTMLNPGDTLVIHIKDSANENAWKAANLMNGGNADIKINSNGFRKEYRSYGLSQDTKVLCYSTKATVADYDNATFFIGKAADANGTEIVYTNLYATDMTYIESYARWAPVIATGLPTFTTNPVDKYFGQAGAAQAGYSACYVYGVDASGDYRCGTIYTNENNTKKSATAHVGRQAGYQELIIGNFYQKSAKDPELMITELLPRTYNLKGEDITAFSAMEITNTSGSVVNVYDYALVRNELGILATSGTGFTRRTLMRAGNPVDRVSGNGAFYYFAQEHIANPEKCELAPGETMVVWFLSEGTYKSYFDDVDFGFNYFRQYWADNGCPEMAYRNTNGEYSVKVIAVDGCDSVTYNADQAEKVFGISSSQSAVYGIARATEDVLDNVIYSNDVLSIAYFGLTSAYFELNKRNIEATDGSGKIYTANILESEYIPANMGMRYVAGMTYSNCISAMKSSLKIQRGTYTPKEADGAKKPWYYVDNPDAVLMLDYKTSNALQTAGLGMLEGTEAYCIRNTLFQGVTTGSNTVYRYFNDRSNQVVTLEGAAIKIDTAAFTELRFDNAIRADVYNSLASTYGADNLKVGMLIFRTGELPAGTALTKEGLAASGIVHVDVKSDLLYHTDEYAVLGSAIIVQAKDFGTEYSAVGYMQVTTADGTVHTYYSGASTSRSVQAVATAAVKDVKFEQDDLYINENNGRYSRYTEEERNVLLAYAA